MGGFVYEDVWHKETIACALEDEVACMQTHKILLLLSLLVKVCQTSIQLDQESVYIFLGGA